MAFDLNTFRTRAGTAVIFAIIMLAGLLINGWLFIILFTIIHFGCWYEFLKMTKRIHPYKPSFFISLGVVYITLPIIMLILCGFPYINYSFNQEGYPNAFSYLAVIPCGIIFSIWINDTMAYIVGSFIGKTPFSKISPKKTWEGTIGGMILCVMVITLAGTASGYLNTVHWMAISAIAAVAGTAGDLFESKLKRMAGVKDSGSIMPGHGGFLDRFDSLLIASPFVFIYFSLFIK